MNEKQQVEHRQCGYVRAIIRAIPTQYGELQTVSLQREWIGRDGETPTCATSPRVPQEPTRSARRRT